MKILALDTSGTHCSAVLYQDGRIARRCAAAPRRHGELILAMMDALLAEAGLPLTALDALAYGHGPGAFTGLRIAAAVTQGAAFGADLPVVGVSTLAALAHGAWRHYGAQRVLAAFDARIGEIYWGAFEIVAAGQARALGPEAVGPAATVVGPPGGVDWGVGDGWERDRALLTARTGLTDACIDATLTVAAHDVALLAVTALQDGAARPPEQALPVYLRERVVG